MTTYRFTVTIRGYAKLPIAVRKFDPLRGTHMTAMDIAVRHHFGKRAYWTPGDGPRVFRNKGKSTTLEAVIWKTGRLMGKNIDNMIDVCSITAKEAD